MNRLHLLALVILAGLLNLMIDFVSGKPINYDGLKYSTLVATALGAIVLAFDWWIWRLPFWHPWFVAAANINGRWKVSGDITPFRPRDVVHLDGTMTVRQTFFNIFIAIEWHAAGETRFKMKMPYAVSKYGYCSFSAPIDVSSRASGPSGQSQTSGFYFQSPERLPKSLTLRYSTDKLEMGRLQLSEHESHRSWRNLWTR